MTVEQAIHERWAAEATLAALIPAVRVTTGRSSRRQLPYVTMFRERALATVRTNEGDTLQEITLRMNIWHADYDAGRLTLDRILTVFDRCRLDLSESQRVLQMRRIQDSVQQHADGIWQLTVRFLIQVAPTGA